MFKGNFWNCENDKIVILWFLGNGDFSFRSQKRRMLKLCKKQYKCKFVFIAAILNINNLNHRENRNVYTIVLTLK